MNRKELAKVYSEISKEEISVKEALKEIEVFLETLQEALFADGKVKFTKIGVFEIFARQPRVIANPSTKELMTIYPKKTVRFRASKDVEKQ